MLFVNLVACCLTVLVLCTWQPILRACKISRDLEKELGGKVALLDLSDVDAKTVAANFVLKNQYLGAQLADGSKVLLVNRYDVFAHQMGQGIAVWEKTLLAQFFQPSVKSRMLSQSVAGRVLIVSTKEYYFARVPEGWGSGLFAGDVAFILSKYD